MDLTRRRVLTGAVAAGALTGCSRPADPSAAGSRADAATAYLAVRPFRGEHQPGVVDEPQQHAVFVALDLLPHQDLAAVRRLLTVWTDDIEHLMAGRAAVVDFEPEMTADAASLTVTVGIGAKVFALDGVRVPASARPAPLPVFAIDRLDPSFCGGDLLLQICADSAVTVSHARWVLTKEARSIAQIRWVQTGFRPSGHGPMRNLFGQVDGIVQPPASAAWVSEGPWRGGSSLVLRRIAMDLSTWEEADPVTRANALGRRQSDGAPLTGSRMTDRADLAATDANGLPVVDTFSHVRNAMPARAGEQIVRRPYSYDDPPRPGEMSNAGLLFASYQASVERQFVPIQRRLASHDLMNTWTTPIGSAVFAIPRGAGPGEVLGQALWT